MLSKKTKSMSFIFFKIWEGILFIDAKGAWREGQIPRGGVAVKELRSISL